MKIVEYIGNCSEVYLVKSRFSNEFAIYEMFSELASVMLLNEYLGPKLKVIKTTCTRAIVNLNFIRELTFRIFKKHSSE